MAIVHNGVSVIMAGAACSGGFGCSHLCDYPPSTLTRDISSEAGALQMMADYAFLRWTPEMADAFHDAALVLCRREESHR